MRFQIRDLSTHGRERHVHFAAGSRQTTDINRLDEYCHSFKPVHANLPKIERVLCKITSLYRYREVPTSPRADH